MVSEGTLLVRGVLQSFKRMKKSDFITEYNREKAFRLFFLQLLTLCATLSMLAAVIAHQITH